MTDVYVRLIAAGLQTRGRITDEHGDAPRLVLGRQVYSVAELPADALLVTDHRLTNAQQLLVMEARDAGWPVYVFGTEG